MTQNTMTGRHAGATVILARLWQSLPTALILAALAGIAFWGHATHWTVPKFSALFGAGNVHDEEWCEEHNVAESQCIECDAALVPRLPDFGWCATHGLAQCVLHHPEIAQVAEPQRATAADFERASRALGVMTRLENNRQCDFYRRRIQFASQAAVEKAGIEVATIETRPLVEAIVAPGQVQYDPTRTARLASRVTGTVWSVEKQLGDVVHRGDVLALVDAAEVGHAKGEFLQAMTQCRLKRTNVERMKPLAREGSIPERTFREAEAGLEEAEIRLIGAQQALVNLGLPVQARDFDKVDAVEVARRIQFLGLSDALVARLPQASTTSNLFPLRAPLEGLVVEREIVAGEVVNGSAASGATLFTVSDVNHLWLTLDVREEDTKHLALGQQVFFRAGRDETETTGTLTWISTSADAKTRTVKARVELANSDGRLRANTFGSGRIVLRREPGAIVVSKEAVHWDGCCHVVFVRDKHFLDADAPKFFHVRQVRPGIQEEQGTEIIAGLLPGEVVATGRSSVLEAQLLKSTLGEGCGCGH